jgi:hypothetical protein
MIVASHFFINTLLQRGVLRGAEMQNRFNGLSKTAEAVITLPRRYYTPLKQGVNEKSPLRMASFLNIGARTWIVRETGRRLRAR